MLQSGNNPSYPHKIALIGNHLPRQCCIATFTTDLLAGLAEENPTGECWAVVMNDIPEDIGIQGKLDGIVPLQFAIRFIIHALDTGAAFYVTRHIAVPFANQKVRFPKKRVGPNSAAIDDFLALAHQSQRLMLFFTRFKRAKVGKRFNQLIHCLALKGIAPFPQKLDKRADAILFGGISE